MIDVLNRRISRRTFLKASAAVGGTVAASQALFSSVATAATFGENAPDSTSGAKYFRTICMMCNSCCGQTVKVVDGVAVKCTGNPYTPSNNDLFTSLAGSGNIGVTNVTEAQRKTGTRMCAKGQAAIMTLYSPYRLTRVLKRTGKRGAGRWSVIKWEEAINSICYGYRDNAGIDLALLPNAAGTANYAIRAAGASLAQIRQPSQSGITPPTTASMPPTAWHTAIPTGYQATLGGTAANQLVMYRGRSQWGPNGDNAPRLQAAFGTKHNLGHESLCNASYKRAGEESVQSEGWKPNLQAGASGPNYVMLLGADWNEANPPHVAIARYLADFRRRGGNTLITSDIRVSQTAAKANTRLIVNPGTDGALVNGIIGKWFRDGTIKTDYLARPRRELLNAWDGRPTGACMVSDAGTLIYVDGANVGQRVGGATAAAAANLESCYCVTGASTVVQVSSLGAAPGTVVNLEPGSLPSSAYVISSTGTVPASAIIAAGVSSGDAGNACTAYELYKEFALGTSVASWAGICGVSEATINSIATGAVASGAKFAADFARGLYAHTNGNYSARAAYHMMILQDRLNRTDGVAKSGDSADTVVTTAGLGIAGAPTAAGVTIDRAGTAYPESNNPMGNGVASGTSTQPRQWYPWATRNTFPEIFASAADGYPYKVKCVISVGSNAPGYTMSFNGAPGGNIDQLKRSDDGVNYNIPLLIDIKTCMDETAAHSDFVLPENVYLERWAYKFQNGYGGIASKITGLRRPVVGTYVNQTFDDSSVARMYVGPFATAAPTGNTEAGWLAGYEGPMCLEDIQIRIGKKLGLPGFGTGGMPSGVVQTNVHSAKQLYDELWNTTAVTGGGATKTLVNDGEGGVPLTYDGGDGASDATTGSISNTVLYMGGVFSDPTDINNGGWSKQTAQNYACYLIPRDLAGGCTNHLRTSIDKTVFSGTAAEFTAIKAMLLPTYRVTGHNLDPNSTAAIVDDGYDLQWHTYKAAWHTQSRTSENKWLVGLTGRDRSSVGTEPRDPAGLPTIWIHPTTATANGVADGNRVRVTSRSNSVGVVGRVQVTYAVRAGSLVCDHHYGRKWFGSGTPDHRYRAGTAGGTNTATVGAATPDRRIGAGAQHGPVVRSTQRTTGAGTSDYNICLMDPISIMTAFNSGKVRISKIS